MGLVFEWSEHGSLKDVLDPVLDNNNGSGVTPELGLEIGLSLASSLAKVHSTMNMGHGALKPSAILLAGPLDSGVDTKIAGFALNPIKSNQGTMTVVPSVAYLSPD